MKIIEKFESFSNKKQGVAVGIFVALLLIVIATPLVSGFLGSVCYGGPEGPEIIPGLCSLMMYPLLPLEFVVGGLFKSGLAIIFSSLILFFYVALFGFVGFFFGGMKNLYARAGKIRKIGLILISITLLLIFVVITNLVSAFVYRNITSTSSFCNGIKDQNEKDRCFFGMWEKDLKNTSVCGNIVSNETRDYCYRTSVVYNPDIAACDKITKEFTKNECYFVVAWKTKNKPICEMINNPKEKENCYERYERNTK